MMTPSSHVTQQHLEIISYKFIKITRLFKTAGILSHVPCMFSFSKQRAAGVTASFQRASAGLSVHVSHARGSTWGAKQFICFFSEFSWPRTPYLPTPETLELFPAGSRGSCTSTIRAGTSLEKLRQELQEQRCWGLCWEGAEQKGPQPGSSSSHPAEPAPVGQDWWAVE